MRAEILHFLALPENAPSDKAARLDKLARALDDLDSAIHALPEGEVAEGWEKKQKPPKVGGLSLTFTMAGLDPATQPRRVCAAKESEV